jgi:hypothetical protein
MRRGQKSSAEQVVLKLRRIEVQTAQGKSLGAGVQGGRDLRAERLTLAQGVRRPEGRSGSEDEGPGARERAAAPARGGPVPRVSGAGGRRLGKLVLYSGFIGQCPFVRILVRRVIGPVELLLLSEVGERRLMMGLEGAGGAI